MRHLLLWCGISAAILATVLLLNREPAGIGPEASPVHLPARVPTADTPTMEEAPQVQVDTSMPQESRVDAAPRIWWMAAVPVCEQRRPEDPTKTEVEALFLLALAKAGYDHRMPSRYRRLVVNLHDRLRATSRDAGPAGDRALTALALAHLGTTASDPTLIEEALARIQGLSADGPTIWTQDHRTAAICLFALQHLYEIDQPAAGDLHGILAWHRDLPRDAPWMADGQAVAVDPDRRLVWNLLFQAKSDPASTPVPDRVFANPHFETRWWGVRAAAVHGSGMKPEPSPAPEEPPAPADTRILQATALKLLYHEALLDQSAPPRRPGQGEWDANPAWDF